METWKGRRVAVTGGAGFLGRHVCEELRQRGASTVLVPRSREFDLATEDGTVRFFSELRPDVVFHLAARVGGIGANARRPGYFCHANLAMGVNLVEGARRFGVDKFVLVGTICSYPKFTRVPFRVQDLWDGFPEETNAPYGIAKKAVMSLLDAYRAEYGLNGISVLPVNLYGPGDNFDLESSHVIPAMIRKFLSARLVGADQVVLWGTGKPTREFLFVEDAARAIVRAGESYEDATPLNLGTGIEISIRALAEQIAEVVGFHGEIVWDSSRPDGQPRRCLDVDPSVHVLGEYARTSLGEGLRATVDWWATGVSGEGAA